MSDEARDRIIEALADNIRAQKNSDDAWEKHLARNGDFDLQELTDAVITELENDGFEIVKLPEPDPETPANRRSDKCLAHFGTIDILADGSIDDDYRSTSVENLRNYAAMALAAARFVTVMSLDERED